MPGAPERFHHFGYRVLVTDGGLFAIPTEALADRHGGSFGGWKADVPGWAPHDYGQSDQTMKCLMVVYKALCQTSLPLRNVEFVLFGLDGGWAAGLLRAYRARPAATVSTASVPVPADVAPGADAADADGNDGAADGADGAADGMQLEYPNPGAAVEYNSDEDLELEDVGYSPSEQVGQTGAGVA
ncbi:hypothetical protein HYH03_018896 [Edaphochlamys debaryana]|uniref:Uncharacterized protein n=1 Tax=Edaphochlamys debaryana TaxID=47281 RepID=A0A835XFN6_9CHLO|nr:hypothetical protein HYH03_018896 [Edaphochlamys debaryana]|eukprot:KAG2482152.1 hypothetical protein HYH03_018896 [Edaphochlamys debaryana]